MAYKGAHQIVDLRCKVWQKQRERRQSRGKGRRGGKSRGNRRVLRGFSLSLSLFE
jgi:hypothetical protein